jgi:glycosyltransferase involved in cell wall biosynthesis
MKEILKKLFYLMDYRRTARTLGDRLRFDELNQSGGIALVIYRLESRSGGQRNIARIANALSEGFGKQLLVYVQNKSKQDEAIFRDYAFNGSLIYNLPKSVQNIITTTWLLGDEISEYARRCNAKWMHIIQDYDELFFPISTKYFHAARVKVGPDAFLASGKWMKLPGHTVYLPFPVDREIYNRSSAGVTRDIDVLMFHKPELPRRCAYLCEEIANELLIMNPNIRIGFYGAKQSKWVVKSKVTHFGALPSLEQLAVLYRRSKIGISLNLTNPSLIPFEQMACGCYPLSPHIEGYPEFDLPGIHVDGSVKEFATHVLDMVNNDKREELAQILDTEYITNGFICGKDEFPAYVKSAKEML